MSGRAMEGNEILGEQTFGVLAFWVLNNDFLIKKKEIIFFKLLINKNLRATNFDRYY